jgi:hypothetical protein
MTDTRTAHRTTTSSVTAGAAAGVVAWLGMAGWALLGVVLAGFGAGSTPAAVALALGGSVGVDRVAGPMTVTGVLLAVVLTSWERVAGAAAVHVAALVVLPFLPAGELDIRFWPTVLGGLLWLAVVVGVRVAMWRVRAVRDVVLVLLGAAGVATVAGALASIAGGARVLGTMVLAAPNLLSVALTRGLGTPWTVHGPDLPLPTVDTGTLGPIDAPLWPLLVLAAVVSVLVALFAGWHTPWVTGVCFGAMALLAGARVDFQAALFRIELGVSGNVLVAAGTGVLAGATACLCVQGVRYWHRRRT